MDPKNWFSAIDLTQPPSWFPHFNGLLDQALEFVIADLIILAPPVPSHRDCNGNVITIKLWTGQEQQSLDREKKFKHWITVAIEIRKWDKRALMLCHAQDSLLQRPSDGQSLPREEYFLNDASEEDCRWQSKHVGSLKNRSYSLFALFLKKDLYYYKDS